MSQPTEHSSHKTFHTMFPPKLRLCFKGRVLPTLSALLALSLLVFIFLSLPLYGRFPLDSRVARDSPSVDSFESTYRVVGGGANSANSPPDDVAELAREFGLTNATVNSNLISVYNMRLKALRDSMNVISKSYSRETSYLACDNLNQGQVTVSEVTIIYSLVNLESIVDATLYLKLNLESLSGNPVTDVIVTAEENAPVEFKEVIEALVDPCSICRVFYFPGSVWTHRNSAAKFAHGEVLVFYDVRALPLSPGWLLPLISPVRTNPRLVASPQLRLRSGENWHDSTLGVSRNELTWGLTVVRAPVLEIDVFKPAPSHHIGVDRMNTSRLPQFPTVNQTAVLREVFVLRKDFLRHLDGFDIQAEATSGEHALFSLKVLHCGGEIVLSPCSTVSMQVPELHPIVSHNNKLSEPTEKDVQMWKHQSLYSGSNPYHTAVTVRRILVDVSDFLSLSFQGPSAISPGTFFNAGKDVWLDGFSQKHFSCVLQSQTTPLTVFPAPKPEKTSRNRRGRYYSRPAPTLTNRLRDLAKMRHCPTGNYRYVAAHHQTGMSAPARESIYHGYIRSLDGLYAFGISPALSQRQISTLVNSQPASLRGAAPARKSRARIYSNRGMADSEKDKDTENNLQVPNNLSDTELIQLVLTRNASEWVGPFSFTKGNFVYHHAFCVTQTSGGHLTLRKCVTGMKEQAFTFLSGKIKFNNGGNKCLSADLSKSDTSSDSGADWSSSAPLFMKACPYGGNPLVFSDFKLDTRFRSHCV